MGQEEAPFAFVLWPRTTGRGFPGSSVTVGQARRMTDSGWMERPGLVTPRPGEQGFEEQTHPDVLEFFNRRLGQGGQQRDAGPPS